MTQDIGARNLVRVFLGVWSALGLFYAFLMFRSLLWSPSFYIDHTHYESQRPLAQPAALALQAEAKNKFARDPGVRRGRELFRREGCALCHGLGGKKGILSKNYVKDRVPDLATLAERLLLYEPEDVEAVLPALAAGQSLDKVDKLDLPNPAPVVAKYADARKVILDGNPGGKKDEKGVQPIDMPAWKDTLTEPDINRIIAYLLTLYPWEEG
ncbi:MAG: c-type cytochrome [Abditibacteriales bacterium]|nr:c-type cytochrome [Abditibacteriales bacterium]MDW8366478.1 c-type cytochrome [Abditibacteriales bacterium]